MDFVHRIPDATSMTGSNGIIQSCLLWDERFSTNSAIEYVGKAAVKKAQKGRSLKNVRKLKRALDSVSHCTTALLSVCLPPKFSRNLLRKMSNNNISMVFCPHASFEFQ
mmetsp:Transcript_3300/g.5789  ORF Transcript_3300/g.5789 Transcript_3300/m.5789 type:complete len:109 (-) Transcript_3300:79-405(-)